MYIINLKNLTLATSFTAAVKGEVVHVKTKRDLKQLSDEQALKFHNAIADQPLPEGGDARAEIWGMFEANKATVSVEPDEKPERKPAKTASKAAAKRESKKAATTRGGRSTDETMVRALRKPTEKDALAPQAAKLMEILSHGKLTRAQLAAQVEKKLKPRQPAKQIYGFYRSSLLAAKLVAEVAA